jgi:hypothetical protein
MARFAWACAIATSGELWIASKYPMSSSARAASSLTGWSQAKRFVSDEQLQQRPGAGDGPMRGFVFGPRDREERLVHAQQTFAHVFEESTRPFVIGHVAPDRNCSSA